MKILYGKKFYRPREIAEQGLITNSKGEAGTTESNYTRILSLIKTGELDARNYSRGKKLNYYLVCEDEIERYNRASVGVEL